MRPLAIALDLDGTLIDSLPDIRAALGLALGERGRRAIDLDETRGMVGDGAPVLARRALAATGGLGTAAEQEAFVERFLAIYRDEALRTTRPFPGVPETLAALRGAGHRLGVCTNKPHAGAEAMLAALGLRPLLHAVLGGDALPVCKPDPAHLWAAVEAMGGDPGRAVMVGDALPDAELARRAGVPFVYCPWGYHRGPVEPLGAAAILGRFAELPAALEGLFGP